MDDDKYIEGYRAFEDGKAPQECPYKRGTQDYREWYEGYLEADTNESGETS